MTIKIEILGTNCSRCDKLYDRTLKIIRDHNLDASVAKITDNHQILSYGIYVLPALVIDKNIVSKGVSLSEKQIIIQINAFLPESGKIPVRVEPGKLFFKRPVVVFLFFIITVMFAGLFLIKKNIQDNPGSSGNHSGITLTDSIDLLYNYTKNGSAFQLTFLEFGSIGCIECKKMEKVLAEVKEKYPKRVNVVFYNARINENKRIFKHFGVEMIPVQVLLDKKGKECFRHLGYYSLDDLKKEFNKNGIFD